MPEKLFLEARIGIIPEVSAQTYGTLAKALREYVTNALDARAKNIWITLSAGHTGGSLLDIRDDGSGMTLEQLKKEFFALGGSERYEDPNAIGRIGIGFLAVVPLCETITIYTKAAGSERAVKAVVQTDSMMSASVRRAEISKHAIGEADTLDASETNRLVAEFGPNFTVFTLEGLMGDIREEFQDPEKYALFEEELRTILPLPWPKKAPLKAHLSGKLWAELEAKAAKHSVNVYLNDRKKPLTRRLYGDNPTRESFLYTQEFHEVVMVAPGAAEDQTEEVRVTGFFACDEPVAGKPVGTKLSGVIARFQNVAVQEHTFFGLEGKEERKKRVSGELFIEGLNKNRAMSLNRNEFSEAYKPVILLNKELALQLNRFFAGVNRVWKARSQVNKGVKGVESLLDGIGSALQTIHDVRGDPAETKGKRWSRPSLLEHPGRKRFSVIEGAVRSANLKMRVDLDADPASAPAYRIDIEDNPQEELAGTVHVRADLAEASRAQFEINGTKYRLQLVEGSAVEPPCALDVRNRFVVLNDAHPLVRAGDKSIIRVLLFIAYASEVCNTAGQMKQMLIQLMLGAPTPGS